MLGRGLLIWRGQARRSSFFWQQSIRPNILTAWLSWDWINGRQLWLAGRITKLRCLLLCFGRLCWRLQFWGGLIDFCVCLWSNFLVLASKDMADSTGNTTKRSGSSSSFFVFLLCLFIKQRQAGLPALSHLLQYFSWRLGNNTQCSARCSTPSHASPCAFGKL